MLRLLGGYLGLGLIGAALLAAVVLEVIDQRAAVARRAADAAVRPRRTTARWVWQGALVLLVAASLAAAIVRIFVVYR